MNGRPQLLAIEILEDRTLMSTCHVTRLADTGQGTDFRGDLRYCINKVNAEPGADTIRLERNGTINLTGALPELSTDIVIVGPGADVLTVRRNSGGDYRIFAVTAAAHVRMIGLTVGNGYRPSDGLGGGVKNQGTLTLIDMRITQNAAAFGGGIYNSGTLLIQVSTVSNNLASGGSFAPGGGIYNSNTGSLIVTNSSIVSNVSDSPFSVGGGIWSGGSTLIQYSTVANNKALSWDQLANSLGGGIFTNAPLTITHSTISGNTAVAIGTGDGDAAYGGGIACVSPSVLTISNSTIANNTLSAVYVGAGGIFIGGLATIMHSTIAGNTEGIRIVLQLTLQNSIVANNTFSDLMGAIKNSGHNLIGNANGGSGYRPSDILDVDPMLGPLADNGGPTLTRALLLGSQAIDAGTNHMAPEWDQRGPGFPRIVNGTIDIGAFEVQSTGVPSQPDFLAFLITADFDQNESLD